NVGDLRGAVVHCRAHFLDDLSRHFEAAPAPDRLAEPAIDLRGGTPPLSGRVADLALAMAVANADVHGAKDERVANDCQLRLMQIFIRSTAAAAARRARTVRSARAPASSTRRPGTRGRRSASRRRSRRSRD